MELKLSLLTDPLEEGQAEPSVAQMSQALIDVEGEISSGVSPSVIVPLIPASSELLSDISIHCDVQSSLRFRSERTASWVFPQVLHLSKHLHSRGTSEIAECA